MIEQTALTSLKSELQGLREQVQALEKVVTEQQEETQSLLHKIIQGSTLNFSPSSNGNNNRFTLYSYLTFGISMHVSFLKINLHGISFTCNAHRKSQKRNGTIFTCK